jgi:sporulation protein YlmC with PRC-barrel domain
MIPREFTMQSTSAGAAAGAARHTGRAMVPARMLDGALARATDGYTLGYVSEVMLDLRTGRVAYALLALDERSHARLLTAVPWHYVALDADGTGLRIALSAATVRGAPAIDLDITTPRTPRASTASPRNSGCARRCVRAGRSKTIPIPWRLRAVASHPGWL